MEYYKKNAAADIFVKAIDNKNNYSIASKNDPDPDGFSNHTWENYSGWEKINRAEAAKILGYDPEEGSG